MTGRASEKKTAPLLPTGSSESSSPEQLFGGKPAALASTSTEEDSISRPTKARRTVLTTNACLRCRQRKTKCDGKHPACARCQHDKMQCRYDVEQEGLTKMQNLQQQLRMRDREFQRVKSLLGMLATGSDEHAAEMLARLRLGESVDDVLERFDSFDDQTNPPEADSRGSAPGMTSAYQSQQNRSAPVTPLDPEWGGLLGPMDVVWSPQDVSIYQQNRREIDQGQAPATWEQPQWSPSNIDPAISRSSFGRSESGASSRRPSNLAMPHLPRGVRLLEQRRTNGQLSSDQSQARETMDAPVVGLRRSFWTGASPFDAPKLEDNASLPSDKRKR